MYFLILKIKNKKRERERGKDRKKTKGYTDMYVQPNIGTPLKQPIRDFDRMNGATHSWVMFPRTKRPEVWIGLATKKKGC